jgi:hypothetical protein
MNVWYQQQVTGGGGKEVWQVGRLQKQGNAQVRKAVAGRRGWW